MKYWTRDREAGNKIEFFRSKEEAEAAIIAYEEEDRREGSYEPNFYEVFAESPQSRYQSKHARQYVFRVFDTTDADMIAHLDSKENKSGYIKELIRADMNKKPEA